MNNLNYIPKSFKKVENFFNHTQQIKKDAVILLLFQKKKKTNKKLTQFVINLKNSSEFLKLI